MTVENLLLSVICERQTLSGPNSSDCLELSHTAHLES